MNDILNNCLIRREANQDLFHVGLGHPTTTYENEDALEGELSLHKSFPIVGQ